MKKEAKRSPLAYTAFVYGLYLIAGGLTGYCTACSIMSLVMGSLFGLLMIGSGVAIDQGKRYGGVVTLSGAVLMTLFFLWRLTLTHKFFPAGLTALVSVAVILIFALSTKRWWRA